MEHDSPKHLKNGSESIRRLWPFLVIIVTAVVGIAAAFFVQAFGLPGIAGSVLYHEVTVEAGDAVPPAEAFLMEEGQIQVSYVTDVSSIDTKVPGEYSVELRYGQDSSFQSGKTVSAVIRVVDTVAPKGITQDLTAYPQVLPNAEDFLSEIQDATAVTVRFLTEPDGAMAGNQTVDLLLTDAGGNTTTLHAVLTLIIDQEAPVITGVSDFNVYVGDTIAYRSGVTVTDDQDASPTLQIDSSAVDLSAAGVYQVVYTAKDAAGNSASVTAKVSVYEKQDNFVEVGVINEAVDGVLSGIIDDGMTNREKVTQVYWWIRNHCSYVNHSDKGDWMQAAYTMLKDRQGDCYNYFALCKLMLERLGIPNIDVSKIPNYEGDSHHYWSLVSVDGGKTYYHVDITPRKGDSVNFLLVTDAFMDSYSASHNNCFNRDRSLYPATPEE